MSNFIESDVEEAALYYFEQLGYTRFSGSDIAPEEPQAERTSYTEVILESRLRSALAQINPKIPTDALDEVVRQVLRTETQNPVENNRRFHRLLTDGVPVIYQEGDRTVHDQAWLIDWHNPGNNDWLVVNQFTVIENRRNRRPDVVFFINGLPLVVIELKNAASQTADIEGAFNQLQTYKRDIPSLFTYNAALLISDGLEARIGTITADRERFMPWRTIDGSNLAPKSTPELEIVIRGKIKVVMTGSASDSADLQPHIRSKKGRDAIANCLHDPNDPLKLIVRDMWLTGFDAPCLHTMYIDKPMKGHNLMQAIARVNRVFGQKPGGLVVDYLGIAQDLKAALMEYTEGDRGETGIPIEEAVALMQEKYEIVAAMFHSFDYSRFFTGTPPERLTVLREATDWILRPDFQTDNGTERYIQAVTELSKAFALCATEEAAIAIREEMGFFQAIKATLSKHTVAGTQNKADLDAALRQIVTRAVASDQVIDIFGTAGLDNPEISILSDEFLEEVRDLPQKNLALEVLRKLLNDEIRSRSRRNVVQSRTFSEMLENSIRRYQNRSIESAQVIQELINLAKEMREANQRWVG